ncbi:Methyl-accepting chemotaxis protein [Paramagnetospirillum magnetotacticum MS-1]|uniref:Methyl-accepting chemotaxis protein n=1 Tax=Paramagnetospirillum magnetotacticum MS-1 TaxID=272627 RepID=A0A0C2UWZ3_PARME|nr:methyl-accepting chemotaxis protein [Paramagnetospirillum magnetotacticum]KIL97346.1 Methyl-accepting chemotaxis protein [Paramagnetospirillum magnetotacticum MS-1]
MGGMKLGIGGKIWSLVALLVVGLGLLAVQSLSSTRETLMDDRRQALRQVVDSAASVVESFRARAAKGEFSEEQAQRLAKDTLRGWRYGNNDYVFINTYDMRPLMHPMRPEMEGQDQSEMKDPKGVYVTRAMNDVAQSPAGSGFASYHWARVKDAPPVPKLVYVANYRPWNWVLGTGVYIDDIDEAYRAKAVDLGVKAAILGLLAAVVAVLIARSITGPLGGLVNRMRALADGDTDRQVEGTGRNDEIGSLARAMEVFRGNAKENRRLLDEQEQFKNTAAKERSRALQDMAEGLEHRVKSAVDAINQVGQRLNGASQAMTQTADQTSEQTSAVVAATEQTSSNVQTVASAAEELSSSGNEITRQVALTADIARAAAEEAEQTNAMVAALAAAAGRIGEVVKLIDAIAGQTNLLALNATIEAARAGEAGKGFAVVAGEVKTLANQTAKATQEITTQIAAVQTETTRAVAAIRHIGETINKVDEATSSIASAVEEQNAAIHEITRSVQEAARGTREVSEHIGRVSDGARTSKSAAEEVAGSARDMVTQNGTLTREIDGFLREIRTQAA